MITLLAKLFIKCPEGSPRARSALGTLCGVVGVVLNVLLFAAKYLIGALSGSVAIAADAVNNLSDAGSSLITLAGFRIAGKKPDSEHPFGHGRAEYLAGAAVSVLIVLVGAGLAKDSVLKIITPEPVNTGAAAVAVLAASIAVKGYMFFYNMRIGKRIDSSAMQAAAKDSISDVLSTGVVLFCTVISAAGGPALDAWCGLAVSAFILFTGVRSVKETVAPLLGTPPSAEFVAKIEEMVLAHTDVVGIHDLVVHDYGPGRLMISLHAEVDGGGDIFALHDEIDCIERELNDRLCAQTVIHLDPIVTDDETVNAMRRRVAEEMKAIGEGVTIHDFRMVMGPTHTNLIFDILVPHSLGLSDGEVRAAANAIVEERFENMYAVIEIDRPYV